MAAIVEERWREERRGRLLDAASRVFSKRPYGQASMDEIALEAGVGKPTLYRYFPGKDALFAAVFVEALDELEARLDAVLAEGTGVEARLVGLVAAIVPTFRAHLVPLRFLDEAAASADQSKRRIFRERRARIARRLADALAEGVRAGDLREIDPERTAELAIGMIWSASARSAPDDDVAREIVDIFLRGVGSGNARDLPWPGSLNGSGPIEARPSQGSVAS